MKRNFNEWVNKFIDSVADWRYYTDFPKVYNNVDAIKVELNLLNSLINSKDIENDFRNLVTKYPEVLKAVPILIAKRGSEVRIVDKGKDKNFNFNKLNYTIDEYVYFMDKTGLFDLLSNHIISDLLDYVKGVEVGLDSNARKNRTGKAMENIVESFIVDAGFIRDVNYFKEMRTSEIRDRFGIDLQLESLDESKAEKRFDFVIKSETIVYAIEVNFYSGGGSKLNETARSYKMLAQEASTIPGFRFVWITDGIGWNTARRNLEETFDVLEDIYNINDLESGILSKIIK
ncbi:MAG TPA: restriction endonuclease [Acholeplasmataceae bacterium]|jgi:type II restriction enzyme|nr:restriction endonuclease [Acholeplasmataceae bacterium]